MMMKSFKEMSEGEKFRHNEQFIIEALKSDRLKMVTLGSGFSFFTVAAIEDEIEKREQFLREF
jgi:hypothetical protein